MRMFLIQVNPKVIEENFVLLEVCRPHIGPTLRLFLDNSKHSSRLRHDVAVLMAGEGLRLTAEYSCHRSVLASIHEKSKGEHCAGPNGVRGGTVEQNLFDTLSFPLR